MFSRSRRPGPWTRALAGLCALAGAAGCGHKAPPFPPPLKNPAQTLDLVVAQRGSSAILTFTFPMTTVSGQPLEPLTGVELWQLEKPIQAAVDDEATSDLGEAAESVEADDGGAPPEPDDEQAPPEAADPAPAEPAPEDPLAPSLRLEDVWAADPLEFQATASLARTLDAEAIELASRGASLVLTHELGEPSHETRAHTFAIKTRTSVKLVSAFSNLATLVQRRPPSPPADFEVSAQSDGVRLAWRVLDAGDAGDAGDAAPEAFHVYRRRPESRTYGPFLLRLPGEATEHLDRSAAYGERYVYAVTSVGHVNPVIESFFGGERELDYADRFAPRPPTNLVALADAERVRLLWDASPDDDVVGYVVFRREEGSDFRRLVDEPVLGLEYSDRSIAAGDTYEYRVAAVDRAGNQGKQSEGVVARVE